ncbi:MAG: DDE-type integrase/transposase/recombinase, partial [Deltaproteobacteria bacterium]|nr:DDE-type integrase/transposase/recombinase [Deltaproteobacteria bacterium]
MEASTAQLKNPPQPPLVKGGSEKAHSAKEIAAALGISIRAIQTRAVEEGWSFQEASGLGGRRKLYPYAALPFEARRALDAWELRREGAGLQRLRDEEVAVRLQEAPKVLQLPEKERRVALARLAVLTAAERFCLSQAGPKTETLKEFYGRLNAVLRSAGGEACGTKIPPSPPLIKGGVYAELDDLGFEAHEIPEVLGCIKKVSWQTAYKWEQARREKPSLSALGRGYGKNAEGVYERPGFGAKTITADMQAFVRALFWKGQVKLWPKGRGQGIEKEAPRLECNRALVYRRLQMEFAAYAALPHYGHFTKWLNGFLLSEQEKLAAICLPSFWRATFQPKGGLSSEQASYFGERWEIDATPADVMLQDGRYEILAVVDIFSRDALIEVEKHATSMTVAKLLRQGFLTWGVPEWLIGDRGLIFRSKHIQTACAQMGIAQRDCDAYAPWQKPHVETFFGSLARMLFEALPWYIGHNTVQRKRIDEFHRFQEVFYHRKNPEKLSCEATAEELRAVLNDWLEKVYRAETHRFADCQALGRPGLVWERQAKSPKRAARIASPEHLDTLLAPAFERVYASGIQWEGMPKKYMPDSSEGWKRAQEYQAKRVIFKPSLSDISQGTLWERQEDGRPGAFICRLKAEIRGDMGVEEYNHAKASIVKAHKGRRRLAEGVCGPIGYDRALAAMPKPKVAVAGFGAPDYQGGAYDELKGYDERGGLRLMPDPDKHDRITQDAEALTEVRRQREQVLEDMKQSPEVQEYVAIITALAKGEKISPEARQTMKYFEYTDEFRRLEDWFKAVKMRA